MRISEQNARISELDAQLAKQQAINAQLQSRVDNLQQVVPQPKMDIAIASETGKRCSLYN